MALIGYFNMKIENAMIKYLLDSNYMMLSVNSFDSEAKFMKFTVKAVINT
jgi:hypothetical protein